MYVENTPLADFQTFPERVSQAQRRGTQITTLQIEGIELDYLVVEQNEGLVQIDGPPLATLGTVGLVDLPELVLEESFLAVTFCAALSVVRVPRASTAAIDALGQRCGLFNVSHCGNLDDAPCE